MSKPTQSKGEMILTGDLAHASARTGATPPHTHTRIARKGWHDPLRTIEKFHLVRFGPKEEFRLLV